jgi:hypothetical protein
MLIYAYENLELANTIWLKGEFNWYHQWFIENRQEIVLC